MAERSTTNPITVETVMAGRLRDCGHADATDWFATLYQHTTIPRLQAMDKHPRRRGSVKSERIWQVDGVSCASLNEAIDRLAVPPVITAAEQEILGCMPTEWTELHNFRTALGERLGRKVGIEILMLRQKGLVENELRRGEQRSVPWVRRSPAAITSAPQSGTEMEPRT